MQFVNLMSKPQFFFQHEYDFLTIKKEVNVVIIFCKHLFQYLVYIHIRMDKYMVQFQLLVCNSTTFAMYCKMMAFESETFPVHSFGR